VRLNSTKGAIVTEVANCFGEWYIFGDDFVCLVWRVGIIGVNPFDESSTDVLRSGHNMRVRPCGRSRAYALVGTELFWEIALMEDGWALGDGMVRWYLGLHRHRRDVWPSVIDRFGFVHRVGIALKSLHGRTI
jgi:hypothetical protein